MFVCILEKLLSQAFHTNPTISVLLIAYSSPFSFFLVTYSCLAFVKAILKQPFCSLLSPILFANYSHFPGTLTQNGSRDHPTEERGLRLKPVL
jgi:hypothetical protein